MPRPTAPPPPPPAAAIPTPAGTAGSEDPRYLAILELYRSGASEAALLAKIRSENTRYDLATPQILELRQAGVPEAVVAAMLRSGR